MKNLIIIFFITLLYACNKEKRILESKIYYADIVGFSHNKMDSNFCFLYLDLDRDSIFDTHLLYEEKIFRSYYEKFFFYKVPNIPTLIKVKYFPTNDSIVVLEVSDYKFDNYNHYKVFFSDTSFIFDMFIEAM